MLQPNPILPEDDEQFNVTPSSPLRRLQDIDLDPLSPQQRLVRIGMADGYIPSWLQPTPTTQDME